MNHTTAFLKRYSLMLGIVLMFLLTWPLDLVNTGLVKLNIPFIMLLFLGWGFGVASVIMTGLTLGWEAVFKLIKRYFHWRVNWKWYLLAILLMPALRFAAIPVTAWLTGVPADYSHPMIRDIVPLDWPLIAIPISPPVCVGVFVGVAVGVFDGAAVFFFGTGVGVGVALDIKTTSASSINFL